MFLYHQSVCKVDFYFTFIYISIGNIFYTDNFVWIYIVIANFH